MRVSYTSLAVAALFFVAACGTSSPEIVAPGDRSPNTVAGDGGGLGMSGSGNRSDATASGDGIGQFGSGNAFASDTSFTSGPTAERGIGQFGSGN
jgi:hypothetical protein